MLETVSPGTAAAELVLKAAARIIRPLVKTLIAHGITYQQFDEVIKRTYVDVARSDFCKGESKRIDSRLRVLTGLQRREVKRLSELGPDIPAERGRPLASIVFTKWATEADWAGRDGKPLVLPRQASGRRKSFDALARSVSQDVHPRAVLTELVRQGAASIDENDRVQLNFGAFVPKRELGGLMHYFGENVGDHLGAATANLLEDGGPFLEQSVLADRMSEHSAAELGQYARELWAQLFKRFVPRAEECEKRDIAAGNTETRVRLGIYYYSEKKTQHPDTP